MKFIAIAIAIVVLLSANANAFWNDIQNTINVLERIDKLTEKKQPQPQQKQLQTETDKEKLAKTLAKLKETAYQSNVSAYAVTDDYEITVTPINIKTLSVKNYQCKIFEVKIAQQNRQTEFIDIFCR